MNKEISIIGSGFSSLSAACYLAKAGNKVTVYEKNETIGGRARQLKKVGFKVLHLVAKSKQDSEIFCEGLGNCICSTPMILIS